MREVGRCSSSFFVSQLQGTFSVAQYPLRNSAILDTGTTIDVFNEITRFINLKASPNGDFLWAGTQKVPIQGYGDVDIEIDGPIGKQLLRIYNAAFCMDFACNLVSYRKLKRRGFWWDNRPGNNCLRRADHSILAFLKDRYDQFILEDLPENITKTTFFTRRNSFNSYTKRRPSRALAKIWHLRLGHPGPQVLEHIVNCSQGVRIKGPTTVQCDECGTAKTRRQIRREPRERGSRPAQRLAVDFHDFEEGRGGYKNLMLISDRYSGLTWDFYLEDRTAQSIINALSYLFNLLEQNYNLKPEIIECDNEITTQKPRVFQFLQAHRLKLEPSAPYTQAQNGGAERLGGVIKQKIRAMRGKLPSSLWPEISRAAVYLYNRSPKYMYQWRSPYELFYAMKPAQEHLRAYGCKAFAMTTDALKKAKRSRKLDPKAWIGYLVGYNATNIYRIWIPLLNRVISTRDVIFNEDELFTSDLEALKDDIREVDLEDFARLLQKVALPDDEDLPQREPSTYEDSIVIPFDDWESSDDTKNSPHKDPVDATAIFDPFLTPPPTPAALLSASIQDGKNHSKESGAESWLVNTEKHHVWPAAFLAGRVGNATVKVENSIYDRAKLQRLLQKPRSFYRRDLPTPPTRHDQLQEHPMGHLFEQAEEEHLKSHRDMKSWSEILRSSVPKKQQILDCMWVYVYKFDKHGRFCKCKARLVVRGDQQARSLRENTYAATLAGRSFRTLIAIAARFDLELIQYDAVNAFVNAKLDEDIYMKMPPGHRRSGTILKLHKALYGLRKSPLLWQRELTLTLTRIGFKPVPHEPCCLTNGGVLVFFYVDDIVFAYKKQDGATAETLIAQFRSKYNLTGGDQLQWFLGIEVLRDREKRLIWLSQSSYIDKISRLASTLLKSDTPMGLGEQLPYDGKASAHEICSYQKKIGSLLYVAVITRPDIAFATSRLARFNINPSPEHQKAADRALSYLQSTRFLALQLGGADGFEVASDASFADNTLDRKSSQAYAMKLFGGLIGWKANKQNTVTTSTTEAELLALSQTAKESIYVSRLLEELSVRLDSNRIQIQCDNHQTIRLVTDEIAILQTKLRHVDIHNHWLRQEVLNKSIEVVYTPTAKIMADGLTKALQGNKFNAFINQLGLVDIEVKLSQRRLRQFTTEEFDEEIQAHVDQSHEILPSTNPTA